jgi:RNA polymerase sigma factor (sigma-70 family)
VLRTLDDDILDYPGESSPTTFRLHGCSKREPDFTELAVQRCLNRLARISDDGGAQEIVRDLLSVSADRLQLLCTSTLKRNYPRLARGPLNLRPEELLSTVVERLIKAMRSVRPVHFRHFFALAVKHIRWELNEQAREMDNNKFEPLESDATPQSRVEISEQLSPMALRMLEAIHALPPNEREAFELVRLQGMTQSDAAEVLGVSVKTVQRRLNRVLPNLWEQLRDLQPV